jgi:hypothetical protein
MKWLMIALFIIGSQFALAGYGANDRRKKRACWTIAILFWIAIFIIANLDNLSRFF